MAKMNTGKRYAIIVGVTTYEDDQISSLQYTRNDAIRMADVLLRKGSFDRQRVYLLVDGTSESDQLPVDPGPPTKGELLRRLKYVVDSADEEDLILLFFAGHGAEVSKSSYLLTTDTKMDVLQHTAVKVTDINDMLGQAKARCVLRVFDACRSPFGEGRGVLGRMTDGLQDAMLKTATGWASFSSCSSGEVAYESGEFEHGIFTYYLCEGLEGRAGNDSGEVPFERLVDYVKTSVGNWSDEQSQRQTPHVQSDLSGQLVLTSGIQASVTPPEDSKNPLDFLRFGIEKHLTQTPEDTRNLTFTDEKERAQVCQLAQSIIGQLVQAFTHPSLIIEVGDNMALKGISRSLWQGFVTDMKLRKVISEYKDPMDAVQIQFSSSEVVVSSTTLTVGVARFSFFYWLWYLHSCDQTQLQGSFKAEPQYKSGFFTFKPKAALDRLKMENSVKELFKRACEDILSWSQQLGEFVNDRLTPLREIDKIVE